MLDLATTRRWSREGTALFTAALDRLDDGQLAGPTALPGWTGRHLVAHVAGNAEALLRLVHWARTGEPTPMYASPDQRDADIERGATQPPELQRRRVHETAGELEDALAALTPAQWQQPVRTCQGRDGPAPEIPWMRARELMLHAVDLPGGVTTADLPEDFLLALVDDVTAQRSTGATGHALTLRAAGRAWTVPGLDAPVEVQGPLSAVAAYLVGRPTDPPLTSNTGQVPDLPAWL